MEIVRKINDELAIAGPVTVEQFQQLAAEGFQAVLSLRSMDKDTLFNEQHCVEVMGLDYLNVPIDSEVMNAEIAIRVLQHIDAAPKPMLVYCNNAIRAAAMVLMYIAMRQGEPLQQAFRRAENLGLFAIPV